MVENDTNCVYVGSQKPLANYLTAILIQLSRTGTVVIKARGRAISRAVDAAEICRRGDKFNELEIESVHIGSESFDDKKTGQKVTLSIIEIYGKRTKRTTT